MTKSADFEAPAGAAGASAGDSPRLPDFFVVGHPKSGTTALYEMLRRHPQIYMPAVKELRYLAGDFYLAAHRPASLADYLAWFDTAPPDQRAGEASPFYLASSVAAENIARLQPNARAVAILREPASFVRSLHLQFVESRIEDKNDLRAAIALEDQRRQGRHLPRETALRPHVLFYSEHVRYVKQLLRYHAALGRRQVLTLIYDDFRADNAATLREVLRFLEVDEDCQLETVEANPTIRVRSQPVHQLLNSVSVGRGPVSRGTKKIVKSLAPRSARRRVLRAAQRRMYAPPRPADQTLMRDLRARFRPDVEELSDLIDRDLIELWGYDDVR